MADKKISQLSNASTPLAGTEVLPIVQSATTVKVSIDNVTKGRAVNALSFDTDVAAAGVTLSGITLSADGTDTNIDINITPKGTGEVNITKVDIDAGAIDGTAIGANSASTGAFTSVATPAVVFPATQVSSAGANTLDDYEEGTWTPEINTTTPPTTPFGQFNDGATYTKIGNVVYLRGQFRTNGVTIAGAGGVVYIGGLPYAPAAGGTGGGIWVIDASSWAASTPRAGSAQTNSRVLLHSTATSTGAFAQTSYTALTTGAGLANLVAIGGFYYTAT